MSYVTDNFEECDISWAKNRKFSGCDAEGVKTISNGVNNAG